MKTKPVRYSSGSKFFHWTVATIVILMLSVSFFLEDLPERYEGLGYMLHKSFGLTVLGLMIVRLIWLQYSGKPALPATVPRWQRFVARTVQYGLYLLLFAMPLSGWVMSVAANRVPTFFALFPLPLPIAPNKYLAEVAEEIHTTIVWILIALIVLHIAGALKHYFMDKDKVVQRMWPGE